jgi:hypothetical protein
VSDFQSEWQDWGGTIDLRPREVFTPASPGDISAAITAANQQNRRLRVCGSGWSFSDIAVSRDYIMELSGLNSILALFSSGQVWGHTPPGGTSPDPPMSPALGPPGALMPAVAGSGRRFAHVLGGMVLRDLIVALDSPDLDSVATAPRGQWALPTMGGSAGQTLAGAVSTSTHGGDFTLPPVADMVRAIDLIAADGTRHWFEPAPPAAITDPRLLTAAFAGDPLPAMLHYGDDEFHSVLVSMGCMGVIHSLIIEVVPQFGVSQRVGTSTWNTVKGLITSRALFTSLPPWPGVTIDPHPPVGTDPAGEPVQPASRGLEIFLNPYRMSDDYQADPAPDRNCVVVSRAASPATFDPPLAPGWCPGPGPLEQFFIINGFKSGDAKAARPIIDGLMSVLRCATAGYPEAWSVTDTYGPDPWSVANTGGSGRGQAISVEFAVNSLRGADVRFVDAMLAAFDAIVAADLDAKLAGAFSLRYTLASSAPLAIQNFGFPPAAAPLVCHIEIPCIKHVDMLGNPLHQDENAIGGRNLFELESSSAEHITAFETIARDLGVHLHWGMMSLTSSHDPARYPGFATWQTVRHNLAKAGPTGASENRAFENDFTIRYRISATATGWDVVAQSLLPGSPTDTPAAAETVVSGILDASAAFPPLAFTNPAGCIEVLAINPDGNVCWNAQVKPNASLSVPMADFFPWNWVQQEDPGSTGSVLKVRFAGRIAIGFNRGDGHPEAFTLNLDDGKIYHAWRNQFSDQTWQSWTALDGSDTFASAPDVAMGGNDNLVVVARRADNQIMYRDQRSDLGVIGWNGWSPLPASPAGVTFTGDPCVGGNTDGTLEAFTRDTGGAVWRSVQTQPASNASWASWIQIGMTPVTGDPAVGRNASGTLELFAAGSTAALWHIPQSSPGDWSGSGDWSQISAPAPLRPPARPSVISDGTNLQACAVLTTGDIAHFNQNGGSWLTSLLPCQSPRGDLSASSAPCLAVNQDGRLEVFVKTLNDLVQHVAQDAAGTWPFGG